MHRPPLILRFISHLVITSLTPTQLQVYIHVPCRYRRHPVHLALRRSQFFGTLACTGAT
jgi:hypothetical protein